MAVEELLTVVVVETASLLFLYQNDHGLEASTFIIHVKYAKCIFPIFLHLKFEIIYSIY